MQLTLYGTPAKIVYKLNRTKPYLLGKPKFVPKLVSNSGQIIPSGTVTFLFTDIEGSTALWQKHPASMPAALARHHEILHHAIALQNGYVFQVIGDAFCAAFDTAFEGLNAALAAQRALKEEAWGEIGEIRVRMALHTGAAAVRAGEFTSGEYVSGITLSRAARLLSAGHGGQVLLSSPAAELLLEQLPPHTALRDLGEHRLKDLVLPQQIFQVLAKDLPQEFPPLKTLDTQPNNLPIQLTSFVGRERELAEIRAYLTPDRGQGRGEVRLLTLTGAGGSGKTRLALQVAADAIDGFEKGAWCVELAPITDPLLVPNAVMNALGLREDVGLSPLEALTDYLRAKNLLLVLDNCEHLIAACAQLAHHLSIHCSHLKILATSREPLGIAGEVSYHVPALGLPDPKHLPSLESLSQYAAVRLFLERAVAVQPKFKVTNSNAHAVAQICYRLDGIPLALELAAARVKHFSPEQIETRLDDRFRLLTGGSRTAMPRQQTLQATIEWSYSLLSDAERTLFRRLAVFAGSWSFEAAEAVCAGDGFDTLDVLVVLSHLIDKSLVTADAQDYETRYRMLETLREFALDKLREAGELAVFHLRHLSYFVGFAEATRTWELDLQKSDALEKEHDNLRAALQWSLKNENEFQYGLRLANVLAPFWLFRGYVYEGRARMGEILSRPHSPAQLPMFAEALVHTAYLAYRQTDYAMTRSLAEKALQIFRELNVKEGIADSLELLSFVAAGSGDYAASLQLVRERISLRRELRDENGTALALIHLGYVMSREGALAQARTHFEEGLAIYQQVGNKTGIAFSLSGLGEIAMRQGELERATAMLEESLIMRREQNDKWGMAVSLGSLGWIAMRRGEWDQATTQLRESLSIRKQIGDKGGVAWCLERYGDIATAHGNNQHAIRLFAASSSLRGKIGSIIDAVDRPEYESTISDLKIQLGDAQYSAAWAEGSALTMEQAIEVALRDEERSGLPAY